MIAVSIFLITVSPFLVVSEIHASPPARCLLQHDEGADEFQECGRIEDYSNQAEGK
ncbi:MAG: hypothetical protein JRF50_18625 [Deltaproteobacteria bacterium]|nr:hypothetical protein [Deltaproteobacteria bacterium]